MKKKTASETLVYVIIFLISIILIITGSINTGTAQIILLSIGTSILASTLIYFILSFFTGDPLTPITSRMDNIVTDLASTITLLKQANSTGLRAIWNNRSEFSIDNWIKIIASSDGDVKILSYAMAFLPEHPAFAKLISEKIKAGHKVQILLGNPNGHNIKARTDEEQTEGLISERIKTSESRLSEVKGIEVRYHDTPLYASIFIFGDNMLVTPQLYGLRGAKAPLLQIQNIKKEDSLFNDYLMYFETVWKLPETIRSRSNYVNDAELQDMNFVQNK